MAAVGKGLIVLADEIGSVKLTVIDADMPVPVIEPLRPLIKPVGLVTEPAFQAMDPSGLTIDHTNPAKGSTDPACTAFRFSSAATGQRHFVSCLLVDESGKAAWYGKLADCATSGSGIFTVPLEDVTAGTYSLRIFSEVADDDYFTDRASKPVDMTLSIGGTIKDRMTVDGSGGHAVSVTVIQLEATTKPDEGDVTQAQDTPPSKENAGGMTQDTSLPKKKAGGMALTRIEAGTTVQSREYFFCREITDDPTYKWDYLVVGGTKHSADGNRYAPKYRYHPDNRISDGAIVAIAPGQCALIVTEGRRVLAYCAQPGDYLFDVDGRPTFLPQAGEKTGEETGEEALASLQGAFERHKVGSPPRNSLEREKQMNGQAMRDNTLVFYFDMREQAGESYIRDTTSPAVYEGSTPDFSARLTVTMTFKLEYSYRIVNPILFYTYFRINYDYRAGDIRSWLQEDVARSIHSVFVELSCNGVSDTDMPGQEAELVCKVNEHLNGKWRNQYNLGKWRDEIGLEISLVNVAWFKSATEIEPYHSPEDTDTAAAADVSVWTCSSCGYAENGGRFCWECGLQRP